jgi:hypothetical protein
MRGEKGKGNQSHCSRHGFSVVPSIGIALSILSSAQIPVDEAVY